MSARGNLLPELDVTKALRLSREDVTPLVRLLAVHIDQLEQELIRLKADRDEALAFSRQGSGWSAGHGEHIRSVNVPNSDVSSSSSPISEGSPVAEQSALDSNASVQAKTRGLLKSICLLLVITGTLALTVTGATERRSLEWFGWLQAKDSRTPDDRNVPTRGGMPADLKQAATAGNPKATYELAAQVNSGRSVTRDATLAATLFEKAAADGFPPAQFRIGQHYEAGLGVRRDTLVARRWYQKAAENGNVPAMHHLAVLLAEGVEGKPDYPEALRWFSRAAQHGFRDSQFNLATMLARGLGTAEDLIGAYTWFQIVASRGDHDAAKRRDEVGTRLSLADRDFATHAAEQWRPEETDLAANEVPSR